MKLVKSLLLGSAAGLVAAAGAQAADLPTKKAAPVEYVRICAVHGPGFFYIPGSDTCIRISGRARFEYVGSKVFNKSTDPSSFYAVGRVAFDARTQTDWGLLRAYMRFDFNRRSRQQLFRLGLGGAWRYAFGFGAGLGSAGGFPAFSGQDTIGNRLQTGVGISTAFVQWGGLTAGRIQSFFDFYADNDTWFGITDSDVRDPGPGLYLHLRFGLLGDLVDRRPEGAPEEPDRRHRACRRWAASTRHSGASAPIARSQRLPLRLQPVRRCPS